MRAVKLLYICDNLTNEKKKKHTFFDFIFFRVAKVAYSAF